ALDLVQVEERGADIDLVAVGTAENPDRVAGPDRHDVDDVVAVAQVDDDLGHLGGLEARLRAVDLHDGIDGKPGEVVQRDDVAEIGGGGRVALAPDGQLARGPVVDDQHGLARVDRVAVGPPQEVRVGVGDEVPHAGGYFGVHKVMGVDRRGEVVVGRLAVGQA